MQQPAIQPSEQANNHEDSSPLPAFQRIGRIVAVTGGHAIILLDVGGAPSGPDEIRSPEIGTLLKVETDASVSLALVSALSSPMPSHSDGDQEVRIVEVEFIGELPKDEKGVSTHFRRGISNYPGLGDLVCRASKAELEMAYACDADSSIRIGAIHQDRSIPAMVKIDELLGKHFAVLGTTGTGKSCSVALILRRILEKNPKAHVLLLDVHREYAASFKGISEVIKPENMNLPFWLLNFDEIVEILIGHHASRDQDIEILREMIPLAKTRYMSNQRKDRLSSLRTRESADAPNVGVDTPIPYRASDLVSLLEEYIGKLELKGGLAPYKRIKARIETVTRDPRYAFMFGSLTVQDTMAEVLGRIFRIPVEDKPITVLELGGLPSEIINVVVSVLARLAFDFGLYSGGQVPITFVCEEAHRYVPNDKSSGFEPTKRAISKIAKEGRKYGVSLCIISQRPAELDPTILSQCNTIFSMRLSNELDQEILKAGISDAAASLLEFMPTMGAGEAVTFGEGVALPTRIKFDLLPQDALPHSTTASFTKNWAEDVSDANFLAEVVARWRSQSLQPHADLAAEPQQPAAAQQAAQQPAPQQQVAQQQVVQQAAAPHPARQQAAQQPIAPQVSSPQTAAPIQPAAQPAAAQITPAQPAAVPHQTPVQPHATQPAPQTIQQQAPVPPQQPAAMQPQAPVQPAAAQPAVAAQPQVAVGTGSSILKRPIQLDTASDQPAAGAVADPQKESLAALLSKMKS